MTTDTPFPSEISFALFSCIAFIFSFTALTESNIGTAFASWTFAEKTFTLSLMSIANPTPFIIVFVPFFTVSIVFIDVVRTLSFTVAPFHPTKALFPSI